MFRNCLSRLLQRGEKDAEDVNHLSSPPEWGWVSEVLVRVGIYADKNEFSFPNFCHTYYDEQEEGGDKSRLKLAEGNASFSQYVVVHFRTPQQQQQQQRSIRSSIKLFRGRREQRQFSCLEISISGSLIRGAKKGGRNWPFKKNRLCNQ